MIPFALLFYELFGIPLPTVEGITFALLWSGIKSWYKKQSLWFQIALVVGIILFILFIIYILINIFG